MVFSVTSKFYATTLDLCCLQIRSIGKQKESNILIRCNLMNVRTSSISYWSSNVAEQTCSMFFLLLARGLVMCISNDGAPLIGGPCNKDEI